MPLFEISTDYLTRTLVDLLNTPSPTGDTEYAISLVEGELMSMGVATERTNKGAKPDITAVPMAVVGSRPETWLRPTNTAPRLTPSEPHSTKSSTQTKPKPLGKNTRLLAVEALKAEKTN